MLPAGARDKKEPRDSWPQAGEPSTQGEGLDPASALRGHWVSNVIILRVASVRAGGMLFAQRLPLPRDASTFCPSALTLSLYAFFCCMACRRWAIPHCRQPSSFQLRTRASRTSSSVKGPSTSQTPHTKIGSESIQGGFGESHSNLYSFILAIALSYPQLRKLLPKGRSGSIAK